MTPLLLSFALSTQCFTFSDLKKAYRQGYTNGMCIEACLEAEHEDGAMVSEECHCRDLPRTVRWEKKKKEKANERQHGMSMR